ncbi:MULTISPECIES: diguanylate cyclase [Halomonadaceae]|uniref:GGDEF domain-containing protein n=1 Tax=Halomonadaceae TaxID=28256 RepID=UPI00159AB407|nr:MULTISPECIES: diguanylate cyclase [Halomonas]QJQ94094.1 GGDEF domain-containing protein [Halomonas sp. PA5]
MHDDNTLWPSRLFALVYLSGSLMMAGYAAWHYLMGAYSLILLPVLLALLLLTSALLQYLNQQSHRLSAYLVLVCCYLMIAVELSDSVGGNTLWLGLPPALALLMLPLAPAMLLNLLLAPVWLLLLDDGQLRPALGVAYLAIVILGALAPWEQLRQRVLFRATAPDDPECSALNSEAITERIDSEVARAELLKQRLSILLIHLPQLEMAREQFGSRLRLALLQRFCVVALQTCRAHDSLGRAGPTLFWLVLPDTGENGALMVRNRLLTALEATVLAETGPLTARIGVCSTHAGEKWHTFEQRLHVKGLALMETPA